MNLMMHAGRIITTITESLINIIVTHLRSSSRNPDYLVGISHSLQHPCLYMEGSKYKSDLSLLGVSISYSK